MEYNKRLFYLLKNHKFDKFKEMINKKEDIDLNIRDESNNYLIQYAILYNKIDIVNLLLENNCKIDILDNDGNNILYYPIKYHYNKLLDILLKNIKKIIGILLPDIQDINNLYPIHYCIQFKNIHALKLFIKYNYNLNKLNKLNDNILFITLKLNDDFFFNEKVFNLCLKFFDINHVNIYGESVMHLITLSKNFNLLKKIIKLKPNINLFDYKNKFIPIIYSIKFNDYNSFKNLIKHSNINYQDINGNTVIHHIILNNNFILLNIIDLNKINFNLININSKTILHLILESDKFIDISNLDIFIKNTNLNIQDINGNTCFILLCKKNIWNKYYNVLKIKKCNHLLKNNNKESGISFILKYDLNTFYNLITDTIIYKIKKNPEIKWENNIYNLHNKNQEVIKYIKLHNYNLKNNTFFELINYLLKNNKITFPKVLNRSIDLSNLISNKDRYIKYTGCILDIVFALIYLKNTFKNLKISLTDNFIKNEEISKYYLEKKNIHFTRNDFLNFEINWDGYNIFFPTTFNKIINDFKNSNHIFLIFTISINLDIYNIQHSNILLYDKKKNELERFEPNGNDYPYKFNYNTKKLDNLLIYEFDKYFNNLKYIYTIDYLPSIGLQQLEGLEFIKNKKIGDPGGYCLMWCIYYIFFRLKYYHIDRRDLIIKIINKVREYNLEFLSIIRNFTKKVLVLRNKILKEINLDIDDWLNNNYDNQMYESLIKKIKELI